MDINEVSWYYASIVPPLHAPEIDALPLQTPPALPETPPEHKLPRRSFIRGLAALVVLAAVPPIVRSVVTAPYDGQAGQEQSPPDLEAVNDYTLPLTDTAEDWQATLDKRVEGMWGNRLVGDGFVRIPGTLPDGGVAFLVSDYFNRKGGMPHNTIVVRRPDGTAYNLSPNKEIIPNTPDGQFFWPQGAIVVNNPVDSTKTMFVHALRVRHVKNGADTAFQFEVQGTDIAKFTIDNVPGSLPVFAGMIDTISSNTSEDKGIAWGTAAVISPDNEYIIVDGSRLPKGSMAREAYAARIKLKTFLEDPEAVADSHNYEYWDGKVWSKNPADARPVISLSSSVDDPNIQLGMDASWVSNVLTTPDGRQMYVKTTAPYAFSNEADAYVSHKPEGPYVRVPLFSAPPKSYTVLGQTVPNVAPFTYAAHLIGIQYDPETGETYAMMARSNNVMGAPASILRDNPGALEPSVYRVRIDLNAWWAAAQHS